MKISTAVVSGVLLGVAVGLIGLGKVNVMSPEIQMNIRNYAWWIVVLSMIAPLADYMSGVRTTLTGVMARHPFRHLAGFSTGIAVGLGFLLLLLPRLLI